MYDFYFDSGTTNTRAYLLREGRIEKKLCVQIGSRDSALHNDSALLIRELRRIYDKLLRCQGITDADVRDIYLSGMISSPNGMVEIEHLSTPVSRQALTTGIVRYHETQFFNRCVSIIPGIKTLPRGQKAALDIVDTVNNMRGEEIEIMGILHRCEALCVGRAIILLPGSHTQVVFLSDGVIENISSNITGELYNAILSDTILSSSLTGEGDCGIDAAMVQKGYENLHHYGFNRALYIVRSMLLFTDATLAQRRSYLEGVLNGGVMDAVISYIGDAPALLAVAGPAAQYEIYQSLAGTFFPQLTLLQIPTQKDLPFSVEGLMSLIGVRQND